MDLIKKLNEQAAEAKEEANNPFTILDIKKIRGVNDILEAGEGKCGEGKCGGKHKASAENEEGKGMKQTKKSKSKFTKQQKTDMKRLADTYSSGKGGNVTADDLQNYLGDDLEMLEYNPEDVEKMIPAIIKMTGLK